MKTCIILLSLLFSCCMVSVGQEPPAVNPADADSVHKHAGEREPFLATMNVGTFNILRPDKTTGLFEFQCCLPWKTWFCYPVVGAFVATNTSSYIYMGVTVPVFIIPPLLFRLTVATGLYSTTDDGFEMGFPLEFMTSVKLAYRFRNNTRLGLQFSHISNAGLGENNPGCETLVISYELPFGK